MTTMNLDEMFDEMIKSDTTDEMLSNAFNYIEAVEKENSRLREELTETQWEAEDAEWGTKWRDAKIERLEKELAEARRGVLLETGKPLWKFEKIGRKHLDK